MLVSCDILNALCHFSTVFGQAALFHRQKEKTLLLRRSGTESEFRRWAKHWRLTKAMLVPKKSLLFASHLAIHRRSSGELFTNPGEEFSGPNPALLGQKSIGSRCPEFASQGGSVEPEKFGGRTAVLLSVFQDLVQQGGIGNA
jgi:hypothetical protein